MCHNLWLCRLQHRAPSPVMSLWEKPTIFNNKFEENKIFDVAFLQKHGIMVWYLRNLNTETELAKWQLYWLWSRTYKQCSNEKPGLSCSLRMGYEALLITQNKQFRHSLIYKIGKRWFTKSLSLAPTGTYEEYDRSGARPRKAIDMGETTSNSVGATSLVKEPKTPLVPRFRYLPSTSGQGSDG